MRRSFEGSFIYNEKEEMIGINIGADFCAEHEWGIGRMQDRLGVTNKSFITGVDRRKINNCDSIDGGLLTIKNKKYFYIYSANIDYLMAEEKETLKKVFDNLGMHVIGNTFGEQGFLSAWDEGGFQILFDEKHIK